MRRHQQAMRGSLEAFAQVEMELAGERATALGRAGQRLEDAIDIWRLLVEVGEADEDEVRAALGDIAQAAWVLIVQRECAGFRIDNVTWICRYYDIPEAALRRI